MSGACTRITSECCFPISESRHVWPSLKFKFVGCFPFRCGISLSQDPLRGSAVMVSCEKKTRMAGARGTRHGERRTGETCMVCQIFASLSRLWIIIAEASSTLQPCQLEIPYGPTQNTTKKSSKHSHTTSLQRNPWISWQNVQLNAFRPMSRFSLQTATHPCTPVPLSRLEAPRCSWTRRDSEK